MLVLNHFIRLIQLPGLLIALTGLLQPMAGWGQKMLFTHYGVEDGLQNNIVFGATQDRKGFIWLGTMTGIDRFDGTNFVHYKLPAPKTGTPEFVQVPFLFVGRSGRLWAASPWGLYRYDRRLDRFLAVDSVVSLLAANQSTITAMEEDEEGQIWLGLNNGLLLYQPETGTFQAADNYRNYIRCLSLTPEGLIWAGTNKGITAFRLSGGAIRRQEPGLTALRQMDNDQVVLMSRDSAGRYWVGGLSSGLWVLDPPGQWHHIDLPGTSSGPYQVKSVYHDPAGRHMVATDGGGIVVLDDKLNISDIQETNEDDPNSLSNNGVYHIYRDRFRRIWVTTYGGGINLLRTSALPFRNFYHEINNRNSLSNNMAKAVTEDAAGRLWFGTRAGISLYDPAANSWIHLNHENNGPGFTANNILSLTTDRAGQIWAGSYGGGLMQVNPRTLAVRAFTRNDSLPGHIGTDHVFAVMADKRGRIWAGGIRGPLTVYDPASGLFQRSSLRVNSVNCLAEGSDGKIMAGTDKGLFQIDPATLDPDTIRLLDNPDDNARLKVYAILEDQPGQWWVGTQGQGMLLYRQGKGVAQEITADDGLPTDIISAALKDNNGDLWVSTSHGIAQVRLADRRITTYTRADGLAGTQFNFGAAHATRSGRLIFGSTNGFSLFDPRQIRVPVNRAPIFFTGLTVNNKPMVPGAEGSVLPAHPDELKSLVLPSNQNSFSIDFVSPVPALSGKHLYSWKLEGFDRDWSPPSTTASATYTNLSSGSYVFWVKAMAKGQQNEASDIRKLEIIIRPPWWLSGWAFLVYGLALTALGYGAYNYYKIRVARRRFAERLKLNTSISHEIRTPLTLIKGPVSALEASEALPAEDRENLSLAKRNIEKLEQIIGQFIDYQKTGATKMQLQVERGNLVALVQEVFDSFVPLMKAKQIRYQLDLPEQQKALLFDRDKMEKVLNNLISNAVKYTPPGKDVIVSAREQGRNLQIQVKDTGIGIPAHQQHLLFKGYFRANNTMNLKEAGSGVGLSVTREIIDMHKGQLSFESVENLGTVFTIKLPLHNDLLLPYLVRPGDPQQIPRDYTAEKAAETAAVHARIVVAEDNDQLRLYLQQQLAQAGYSVTALPNGLLALNQVKKYGADLVITDVMMPELNGFQLCSSLKKEMATCHIPVIMLTAIHDREYLLEGYRSGADDFVRKPFDLAYIFTRIENLLQNRTLFRNKVLSVFEQDEQVVQQDTDLIWLKEATETIADNLGNADFSVEKLARMLAMSRPVLFRKFKSITGESPQTYINQIRLRKAVEMLKQGQHSIADIAYATGFSDPKYFSTAFKKHFGKSPSEYQRVEAGVV